MGDAASRTVVFAGPTLLRDEILGLAPAACVRGPIQSGDLEAHCLTDKDTVIIVDGYYHGVNAIRHKEILASLARGVTIIGAASMGALRAAELEEFGMIGIGAVFRAFR